MMQVFRLMGMPDKVIAFDELPPDLLTGLEMYSQAKMPRHWRDFMGNREKLVEIKPYFDPLTRQWVKCDPIVQKGPFAWVIDWEVNNDRERWQEIASFVRRNCPKDFRLLDKLEDMAKPLAQNVSSEITLEPEDVVIIPILKDIQRDEEPMTVRVASVPQEPVTVSLAAPATTAEVSKVSEKPECEVCGKKFKDGRGIRFHMKTHEKAKVAA